MEVGKLYKTKQFYWMLYRSEDKIDIFHCAHHAAVATEFWSKKCKASYIPPNSLFVFLEQKEKHCKVLSAEGNIGWIHLADWCKNDIEEAYGSR